MSFQKKLDSANANAVESTPILIPTYCRYAESLIKESHEKVFHNGIAQTLCYLRSRYWIPRLRELIKKYLRRCSICKRLEGKFFEPPQAPPLPDFRVSENPPFSNVGLDFIGPLLTRTSKDNEVVKSYICLFTCCSTCGIQLETCESLNVSSCRLLFRRFCSRRGLPVLLLSDNASTFKSASQEISKIARSKEIKNYVANKGVTWTFITPRASWMGGSWERMVKSVKRCLKKTLGRSLLTFEEITTIVCEIEAVLNDRPITYCYDDEGGISYPLTPSELINGRCLTKLNDRVFEIINTNEALTKKVRYHRNLLCGFTNRWQTEYLQSLQEVSSKPGSKSSNIEVGEVVIIKDENSPRQMWKLGHVNVDELIKSNDGLIRSAIVRTNTKEGKATLLK